MENRVEWLSIVDHCEQKIRKSGVFKMDAIATENAPAPTAREDSSL